MEQTMLKPHNGWSPEETDLLWKEIRAAADGGEPLRGVFERMGQTLGRKPNSVRNYYYMQLRDQNDDSLKRAAPFETFTDQEIHDLLRRILSARGQGQSVRACVMEMSGGDKTLMLRYQNKYRAVLRKKPRLVEQICRELEQEGLPCPSFTAADQTVPEALPSAPYALSDPDALTAWRAISSLVRRAENNELPENDRLRVQRDLLLMQIEDLQLAAKDVIRVCKEFLGSDPESRAQQLSSFCGTLSEYMARLETVSG